MAQVRRRRRAIAAILSALIALVGGPAAAQDQLSAHGVDLYEHPVLAVNFGMHSSKVNSIAADAGGHFAVSGSNDRTLRVWSAADGKLLRTIWMPVGPEYVGSVYAVAISPDGATIAAGGWLERRAGPSPIYIFDRESGKLIRRIDDQIADVTQVLTFSPDGRYLAAALGGRSGVRVFDRNREWNEAFRDEQYDAESYGAAFAPDGHLAATSFDGAIRTYQYNVSTEDSGFRRVGWQTIAPSGKLPKGIAYSPDGTRLAVGYEDVAAVDILDAATREPIGQHVATDIRDAHRTDLVAWSPDGQRLFAAGAVFGSEHRALVLAWDRGGLGDRKDMVSSLTDGAAGIAALPDGRVLVASVLPCLDLLTTSGAPGWVVGSPAFDFRNQSETLKVSVDASLVEFNYSDPTNSHISANDPRLRFDLRALRLSSPPPSDDRAFAPRHQGLTIDGWQGDHPTLGAQRIPLFLRDIARSFAIAPDARRFFLGSSFALAAYDDSGTGRWRWSTPAEVWAVNASLDGRVVVAAGGDGAISWHRADDGRQLLTLQVLPNGRAPAEWDWVLWTPEGFYDATPGAEDTLRWVVNHGPDRAATTLPVSAIAKLHRRNALPHVLDQLETEHALGLEDTWQARFDVQAATGSAKPPGGVLHVLAVGIDRFGDRAGSLHLDHAVNDAREIAGALLDGQKGSAGKASLYTDVTLSYLPNGKASKSKILDAFDAVAASMAANEPGRDLAVILIASHGVLIDGQFYVIPYGFVADGSKNEATDSAISASELARKVQALGKYGKVLLLLDACHSGAVGAQGWATDPDAKILQDALNLDNVTVLTSSQRNELSAELPNWNHGAFSQAFLDALVGAADSQGIVRLYALTDAMDIEVQHLTNGKQHLGTHVNFGGDLFVATRN